MSFLERYSGAMRTSDLSSKATADVTVTTDNDVIGAVGFATKDRPLAMALARLFNGDNRAALDIVAILSEAAFGKSAGKASRVQCDDIARAVLAWHRDGNCRACTGRAFELIQGAPAVSATHCVACGGTRKMPFQSEFPEQVKWVAWWLAAEVESEHSRAKSAAQARLGDRCGT